MSHQIFISYSSKDKVMADALCHSLENDKVRCWIAPRDISLGANWAEEIAKAVPQSQVLILILSASSNMSKQVLREVEIAVRNGVMVLPIRIEDIVPTGGMAYYLATTHWIDALNDNLEKSISEIKQQVIGILKVLKENKGDTSKIEIVASPASKENAKSAQAKPKNRKWYYIIGAAVILIGIVIGIIALTSNDDNNEAIEAVETSAQVTHTPEPTAAEATLAPEYMEYEFEDAALESFIREMLNKSEDESIIVRELQRITSIEIFGEMLIGSGDYQYNGDPNGERIILSDGTLYDTRGSIRTLDDLAEFTSLETLIINKHNIADISALSNLDNLKVLNLNDNAITNVEAIASLHNLKVLSLSYNAIEDIEPLEELNKLTDLYLDYNDISDISAISSIIGEDIFDGAHYLMNVDITSNKIKQTYENIDAMQRLIIIRCIPYEIAIDQYRVLKDNLLDPDAVVQFSDSGFENIVCQGLNKARGQVTYLDLLKIKSLVILGNQIWLNKGADHYSEVTITDNGYSYNGNTYSKNTSISDISDISYMKYLEILVINSCGVSDITPIEDLKLLYNVNLKNNSINDISSISNLVNLRELDISQNYVSDIDPIQYMTDLRSLGVGGAGYIEDLEAIENKTSLTYLEISDVGISSIDSLETLTSLQTLIINDNYISDLSPLENMSNLRVLDITNNDITDVSALSGLSHLEIVYVRGNNIGNINILEDKGVEINED